jgi:hypothetical protein
MSMYTIGKILRKSLVSWSSMRKNEGIKIFRSSGKFFLWYSFLTDFGQFECADQYFSIY